MNKVFKVIWSEARNAYVVVSEMAKSHGTKSCSTKKLLAMLIATGIMTCASVAPAMAANLAPEDYQIEAGNGASASGQGSVAIGNNAQASGLVGIAIGRDAIASGSDSIAIGSDTKAGEIYSVAVGNDIKFTAYAGTAVGQQAYASGDNATAIGTMTNVDADWNAAHQGQWRNAGKQSTAIGAYAGSWGEASASVGAFSKAEGEQATAVGYASQANAANSISVGGFSKAEGEFATALGYAGNANGYCSTALGDFAKANVNYGVALGGSSVADRESGAVGAFAPEGADSLTWKANRGAVSVGSETITRQITNVAAGSEATDAVNVAQLKAATENAGWNLSTGKEITNPTKVKSGATVDFSGDDENITVSREETDFATLVNVKLNRNLNVDSVNAGDYFMGAEKGIGFGGEAYITQSGLNANDKVITNVAAGVADTDAVNVSQLKNSAWKLAANGVLTEAEDVKAGDYVDFNGDQNVSVSKDAKDGVNTVKVELNKDLVGIESISNGDAKMALNGAAGTAGMINGKGASIYMQDGYTVINSKVAFDQNGKISGVAAGTADTDAVNVSQLKAVGATANMGWNLATNGAATEATNVKPGDYVDFSGDKNISVSHDGTKVKVELNKDLVGIESISNGDAKMALNGAAGTAGMINGKGASIYMQDGYTVINSKVAFDQNGKISGVAAGAITADSTDAVNGSQLHAVATEAGKHTTLSNGKNTTVTSTNKDGQVDYQVNVAGDLKDITSVSNGDSKINLNADSISISNGNKSFAITNSGIGMSYIGADYTVKSIMLGENGTTISGGLNVAGSKITGVAAGAVTADSTDAVNGSQLHAVATEAGKHTTLSNGKNTTVTSTNKDGQVDYQVNVAGDLKDITSVSNGDSKINLNADSISISNGNKSFAITNSGIGMSYIGADYTVKSIMLGENGTTISGGLNVAGSKITGVAAGVADTDAVNVGQLKEAVEAGNTDTHIKPGEYGVGADNTVKMDVVDKNGNKVDTVTIKDVAKASDVGDVNNIANDIKNKEGKTTVVDAVNNLNNKVGDLQYSKVEKGDIADGDSTTTAIGKLDQKLTDVAATAAKHTKVEGSKNIIVENTAKEGEAANYQVKLNNIIDLGDKGSVTTGNTVMNSDGVKVGTDVSLNKDGLNVGKDVSVTATAVTAGKTSISDEGVKVGDKTYISDKGLNANGQNITNVADGKVEKDSKDAINGGQLHQAKADINNRIDGVENQVVNNTNRINKLGSRVNKVGAGAAALAALHPMDFDPDDKLTFSAGYGNYGGENAAAIGAYYRPDEKVMFSVGGTVGNGENMVNAGVSFALDRTNHVSNSRTALAREVIDLRGQLAVMGAKMAKMEKAFGMLDETKTKLFPDIPANHWAYEYIAKLAGNGYIEGYPDGNFGGDRLMTRYEFAAMLYRAIENGAALEEKIIKEFEPELGRIRVDRISGEDGDRDKIERVRVNDTKGERDHYGNKLAK